MLFKKLNSNFLIPLEFPDAIFLLEEFKAETEVGVGEMKLWIAGSATDQCLSYYGCPVYSHWQDQFRQHNVPVTHSTA